jgi:hypothetical protein
VAELAIHSQNDRMGVVGELNGLLECPSRHFSRSDLPIREIQIWNQDVRF